MGDWNGQPIWREITTGENLLAILEKEKLLKLNKKMSQIKDTILAEQEFSKKEIESMPEPKEVEIDNTEKTDQERAMEDKGEDLLSSFAD